MKYSWKWNAWLLEQNFAFIISPDVTPWEPSSFALFQGLCICIWISHSAISVFRRHTGILIRIVLSHEYAWGQIPYRYWVFQAGHSTHCPARSSLEFLPLTFCIFSVHILNVLCQTCPWGVCLCELSELVTFTITFQLFLAEIQKYGRFSFLFIDLNKFCRLLAKWFQSLFFKNFK